jgi:hypothetical protein
VYLVKIIKLTIIAKHHDFIKFIFSKGSNKSKKMIRKNFKNGSAVKVGHQTVVIVKEKDVSKDNIPITLFFNILFSAESSDLYLRTCEDGTKYWDCSQTKPGYACLPDPSSPNGVSLKNDLATKFVKDTKTKAHKCACENFPGYFEKDGECVKSTCVYNSNTYQNGQCLPEKPKRCSLGSIIDDPSSCGCPIGKELSSDKSTCITKTGCRWGTVICKPGYNCSFIESDPNDDGKCEPLSGCADFIPVEKRIKCTSLEFCDTSSVATGVCVPKKGCQYLNPPCEKGEVCNKQTGMCEQPSLSNLGGLSSSTNTNNSIASVSVGKSSIKCCCLPTFGFILLAGLILLKPKN